VSKNVITKFEELRGFIFGEYDASKEEHELSSDGEESCHMLYQSKEQSASTYITR